MPRDNKRFSLGRSKKISNYEFIRLLSMLLLSKDKNSREKETSYAKTISIRLSTTDSTKL